MTIRKIVAGDNKALASIIRNALKEYGADKPGTVYYDDTTDHLFEVFQKERSYYIVAESDKVLLGGAGIYPTDGLTHDTCELVKMYLAPSSRGKGIAKMLMEKCIEKARENGFKQIYIETMPELKIAIKMYEKFGFGYLNHPMGNSGHSGCNVWMIKTL